MFMSRRGKQFILCSSVTTACNKDALFDYLYKIDQITDVMWFDWPVPMLLIALVVFIIVSVNTEI